MSGAEALGKAGKVVAKKDERGVEAESHYEQTLERLKAAKKKVKEGKKVIKGKMLPWHLERQGYLKYYSVEGIEGLALDTWNIFEHEVRTHSGRHVHQGGINLFVLDGKGYTVVDGVRHDWEKGDLIMLPIRKGGVEHQHFNLGDKPARWLAIRNRKVADLIGHLMEQKEDHPEWRK